MRESIERYGIGAMAGLVATIPMTAHMLAGKRQMSWWSQGPLPPATITHRALRTVGLHDDLSGGEKAALTAANHFAYGAAAGAVYGRICSPRTAIGALASGAAYGLTVWSGSYLGWLPAAGLYPSATEDTRERNQLMIAAHVVWGSSLGLMTFLLSRRRRLRPNQRSPAVVRRESAAKYSAT